MDSSLGMRARVRVPFHRSIIFGGDTFATEGVLLNLAVSGCAIQCSDIPRLEEYLQCAIFVGVCESVLIVDVAKVRWRQAGMFGVEFLRVNSDEQQRLGRLVDDHEAPRPQW